MQITPLINNSLCSFRKFVVSKIPSFFPNFLKRKLECKKVFYLSFNVATSGAVIVSKLDSQTFASEFESHWMPYSFGLVLHLSKKLSKLRLVILFGFLGWCNGWQARLANLRE